LDKYCVVYIHYTDRIQTLNSYNQGIILLSYCSVEHFLIWSFYISVT